MILYGAGIVLGLVGGFVVRGKLRRLGVNIRLRWVALLYASLAAQIFIGFYHRAWLTPDTQFAILLGSYVVLICWLSAQAPAHRRFVRWSFAVIAAGTILNFVAIAPNRGIPVSAYAARIAGAPVPAGTANRFAVKHVLATGKTIFNQLGDIIPIVPLRDVISVGDILIGLGVAGVIAGGMRMRPLDVPGASLAVSVSSDAFDGPGGQSISTGADGVTAGSGGVPAGSGGVPRVTIVPAPTPVAVRGAARGGYLDRELTVQEFLAQFASGYAVGKGSDPMSDEIKHPSDSNVVLSQAMSISDANLAGNVHGGVVMKLVDTAAGLAAIKHAHGRVVTVSMDEMSFLEPVFLTDVVTLSARVNDVGRTSMEVGVRVEAENTVTGERRHVSSAYLVFVALDTEGHPRPVPRLDPENDEERRRMEDAKIRRRHRIARKDALMQRRGGSASPLIAPPAPPAPAEVAASTVAETLADDPYRPAQPQAETTLFEPPSQAAPAVTDPL